MKQAVHWKIVKLLTWVLARNAPNPQVFEQQLETSMKTLDRLYQTSAVHKYLDEREAYLIQSTADAVVQEGRIPDPKYLAGRLRELRDFRDKLKAAHAYMRKPRK